MTSTISERAQELVQQTLLGESVDALDLAYVAWNDQGTLLAANRAACALTGYRRDELLALPVSALSHGDPARKPSTGGRTHGRSGLVRAGGEVVEVDWIAAPTRVAMLPATATLFWRAG